MHYGRPSCPSSTRVGSDAWSGKLGANKDGILKLKTALCRTIVLESNNNPRKVPCAASSHAAKALIITSTFKFSSTKAAGGASERGNPLQKRREKTEKEAARFLWHTNKEAFRTHD